MHYSLGLYQGRLSMAAQSPINLCRSLQRLPPRTMKMLSSGRASWLMFIWYSGGLFLRCSPDPDPDPSPAPPRVSDTSPGPSTPRNPANGENGYPRPL